ncbi:MAG TPA: glutamate synthase [Anaerolineae bacterium]|nr:glutamate synthase [Anaerolineae bacterium]
MVEELDILGMSEAELNARLQSLTGGGHKIILRSTHARHNLVVDVSGELEIVIEGSAGFYCCRFMNGPMVAVTGSVGWYAADNMLGGKLIVHGNAGSSLAPSMIGGTVLVYGTAGSRTGYGLKGGTVVVCGDVGTLTGQHMLGGRIVLLGKAGEGTGESMVGGAITYRPGAIAGVGSNARARPLESAESESLAALFAEHHLQAEPAEFECLVPKPGKHRFQLFEPAHAPEKTSVA